MEAKEWRSSLFLKACAYTHTHTSLVTAAALVIEKKKKQNKRKRKLGKEIYIYMRRLGPADKEKESICRY